MKVTNLRAYLANIGMTLKDFSEIIECNSRYLSNVLSGNRPIGPKLSKKIFDATDGLIDLPTKPKKKRKKTTKENNQ